MRLVPGAPAALMLASALLLASAARGASIVPLEQTRFVRAEYTDRSGSPEQCIPGFCIPEDITSSETFVDDASAPDFGPFDASVSAEGTSAFAESASASATSQLGPQQVTFAASIAGNTPVLDFAESEAQLSFLFELDAESAFVLEGTLERVYPPYVAGSSSARIWLEDENGQPIADLVHPPELCPEVPDLCTPLPFRIEGVLAAGVYRLGAELLGESSYYARFDIPGAYLAHLDVAMSLVPEPGSAVLVSAGLLVAAAARRRAGRTRSRCRSEGR